MKKETEGALYCSFCGKKKDEVRNLIAGPNVFICNECVHLCQEMVDEEADCSDLKNLKGDYIYELLQKHFSPNKLGALISYSFILPGGTQSDFDRILGDWLSKENVNFKFFGIGWRYYSTRYELTFSELWEHEIYPLYVGAAQYRKEGLNTKEEQSYLRNGLWLCSGRNMIFAIFFDCRKSGDREKFYFEIASRADKKEHLNSVLNDIQIEFTRDRIEPKA